MDKPELAGDMMGIVDYLTPEQQKEFKPIPVKQRQGKPSFITRLLCMEAAKTKSNQPRRAFVINVSQMALKAIPMTFCGVPVIGKGEKMQGQFFPLLFEGLN
jgi:hypothetical protein